MDFGVFAMEFGCISIILKAESADLENWCVSGPGTGLYTGRDPFSINEPVRKPVQLPVGHTFSINEPVQKPVRIPVGLPFSTSEPVSEPVFEPVH